MNKSYYTFFISDKEYKSPKEEESLIIEKYFDISKNRLFSFTFQNDQLYIILNQNTFGSAFFGNIVLTKPKYFIIKKFNPIFILIQIIYMDNSENNNKEYIDSFDYIQKYEEKLKNLKNNEIFYDKNFDEIFNSSIKLLKFIFEKYQKDLEKISQVKEMASIDEKNGINIFIKRCESKLNEYLNSKVNLTEEEIVVIEMNEKITPEEKNILMNRKKYEKASILEPFIPSQIYMKYLKYKHLDFLKEEDIKKLDNSAIKNNKRKKKDEKPEKSEKKKKKEGERSKGQMDINTFFPKK